MIELSERTNIQESAIAKNILETEDFRIKVGESIANNVPDLVPYFTPEEILSFVESGDFVEFYRNSCSSGLSTLDYSYCFE